MRGLIYKDFSIFCKCVDKRIIFCAIVFTAIILYSGDSYGGLIGSILFSMVIGTQNVLSLSGDDKARWKNYQMAMPISDFSVVASKYISVLCTLGISILASVLINLLSSIVSGSFYLDVWGLAIFIAVVIPLLWTGICLPLAYWFGIQSAQPMGLLIIAPVSYLVKYFEDGIGLSHMAASLSSYLLAAGLITVAVFGVSLAVSTAGYGRRK